MQRIIRIPTLIMLVSLTLFQIASHDGKANAAQEDFETANSTSINKKLFTYTGSLLPPEWMLVSIINDRAVIGFHNGSARNALMSDLEPKDRTFLQRLQNGTVYATPLSSAKEKFSQWSSTVTSTVSKYGKNLRDQLEGLINNNNKNKDAITTSNVTLVN